MTFEDSTALARTMGFGVMFMLVAFAMIFVRRHRFVFLSIIIWVLTIVAYVIVMRSKQDSVAHFLQNYAITITEWVVNIAIGIRLFQYLRNDNNKD